ncbi:MAG: hypothetical protein HY696_03100 [Deltaproteobacteria bacterium]|nr:hypothetical protein [Deltaproteobacteria bacterium]
MDGVLKQYGWLLNCAVVILAAYFLAKIANVYIATLLEVPRSIGVVSKGAGGAPFDIKIEEREHYQAIVDRNIFDATIQKVVTAEPCVPGDARPECQAQAVEPVVPSGEAVKTALNMKVVGTLAVGEGKDSRSSTIISGGKENEVWSVGRASKSFPGTRLVLVKSRRIEFHNNGRLEYAELQNDMSSSMFGPPSKGGDLVGGKPTPEPTGAPTGEQVTEAGPNKFVINRTELDAALGHLDQLYTEIRVVPNFNKEGKAEGVKILSIKPGSLFAKLGLRRGDVLSRINGQDLDVKSGFQLFGQLKEQTQFTLDLQRSSKVETYEYEVR